MALTKVPGQVGYKAYKFSSMDGRAKGKLTDANHMHALTDQGGPTNYDRGIIDIYTQTSQVADDFTQMINKSTPFEIVGNDFQWEIRAPYEFVQCIEIPDATLNNPTPGIDGTTFEIAFDRAYFQKNDIITADMDYGDKLFVTEDPTPYNKGYLYTVKLVGVYVNKNSSANLRWLAPGVQYDKVDNSIGEFDQDLSGLDNEPSTIKMFDSVSAGYGVEHTITGWADDLTPMDTSRDSYGNVQDLMLYEKYERNAQGAWVYAGTRWEPIIERKMKLEMLKMRKNRTLWGGGGEINTQGQKHQPKKVTEGIVSKMRNNGNYFQYQRGDFNFNFLREIFGDLFYRRVDMANRRVKLYTNEAGMRIFRNAAKEDLMNSGITIIGDERFIQGTGQNMTVNYGFDSIVTMETGRIEVSHLKELDLPQLNSQFGQNKMSTPKFMVFDVSNSEGGLINNIREVRQKNRPNNMTWGYIDGRRHHLGAFASQGHTASSKVDGYTIFMEDKSDIFIEDLSRTVLIEEVPQF